jgi:hypothetical protein
MRSVEIDDQDRLWAVTQGIRLDIDSAYDETISLLQSPIQLNSPYRIKQWMPNIDYTIDNLKEIINSNFADDTSTKELKTKANIMLKNISSFKKQL